MKGRVSGAATLTTGRAAACSSAPGYPGELTIGGAEASTRGYAARSSRSRFPGSRTPRMAAPTAVAPRVAGQEVGDAPGLEPPEVHVELAGEDHTLATDVDRLVRRRGRVPELARLLAVCSVQEQVAWSSSWQMNMTYGRSPSANPVCCHHQHRKMS
jgi:hypothetical protein